MTTPGQKIRLIEAQGKAPLRFLSIRKLENGQAAIVESAHLHNNENVILFLEAVTRLEGWWVQEQVSDDRHFWLVIR